MLTVTNSPERSYVCDEEGCLKKFKRSDHLLRHKRNHESTSLFSCSWPGCDKTFVRKDVQSKHIKRHVLKAEKLKNKTIKPVRFYEIYTPDSVNDSKRKKRKTDPQSSEDDETVAQEIIFTQETTADSETKEETKRPLNGELQFLNELQGRDLQQNIQQKPEQNVQKPSIQPQLQPQLQEELQDEIQGELSNGSIQEQFQTSPLAAPDTEMTDLIDWLLNDNPENSNRYLDYSPSSSFKDLLDGTPDFTFSTNQSTVSIEIINKMTELIPELKNSDCFNVDDIEKYLDLFWCVYHIQFPIIHRPTFSTSKAHPLLLLSMITIGASLTSRECRERIARDEMIKLAETIAQPLRWLICSHSENFSTIFAWIIQSLLILECFEITSSSRKLHRRAHLHHGFKVELLRRSPLLGGDPSKANNTDNEYTGVWENWVEIESLKRCAYMTFLVDTWHAIIFGHETILFTHHMKLSLPCADVVWETVSMENDETFKNMNNEKLLSLVTNILRQKKMDTSPLISKIMLGALVNLVFQTEQNDLQTFPGQSWKSWRNELLGSLDFWYDNVIDETCCQLENAYYCPLDLSTINLSKPDDTTCKFPVYHIASAFLRLSQYDCIIYAGAPNRMNVKADSKDYAIVEARVKTWAESSSGRLAVAHAYVLLFEILLSQDDFGNDIPVAYDPNRDPVFYRANIVASALFLIWDYNYCLEGTESDYLESSVVVLSSNYIPEKLNGYKYLQKIKRSFVAEAETMKATQGSKKFQAYAQALKKIPNKHHLVGLFRLLKDRYNGCNSQVCREYSRLMENCIQRSLGRKEIVSNNMYEEV